MTDKELNKMLFNAYLFGQRVLHKTADVAPMSAADDKSWSFLQEIADGTTTLTDGAAEMLLSTPIAPSRVDAIKDYLARVTPMVIQQDREMARRILAGAELE